MILPLALSLLLAADSPESAVPVQAQHHPGLFALTATAGALSAAAALCGWPARESDLGRACAITGGAFGGAALGALVGFGFASLGSSAEDSLEKELSRAIGSTLGAIIGLGVGALASIFASIPSGTPRGVLAIAGGGLGFVGATFTFVYEWNN